MRTIVHLAIFLGISFNLLGYYPAFGVPPIRKSTVLAQVQEQREEIISSSFSKPLILPHPGYLSTRFSSYHPGIDIAAGLGLLIHPILDGTVEEVGHDIFGLGNFVAVSHEKGFKSKYAHMGRIFVKTGSSCKNGCADNYQAGIFSVAVTGSNSSRIWMSSST